jgi:cystathionine gamma-synthase
MSQRNDATAAVRCGIESDSQHGAVVPPLYLSSNFAFAGFDHKRAYDYTRSGNPTRDQLGQALSELEGGCGCVVTSSGMAAVALVLHLLQGGDRVLAPHDGYGGTWRLLQAYANRHALGVDWVDFRDAAAVDRALAKQPRLCWIETPSNPLLRVTDIRGVAAKAKANGALVAVDNTFLSPLLQKPLALGADLVVHSTTKYLNCHSDVVGGAVIAKDPALHQELTWWANCVGLSGAPFDAFLTLRGVRTLAARMAVHERNAQRIARFLQSHAEVAAVHYPGLEDHPDHALAKRQQRGFGGMLSFELRGGVTAVRAFVAGLQCFSLAESLGGVESLIAHPATMTHAAMSEAARATAGIGPGLLRLSVGIEDVADLCADLDTGLQRAATVSSNVATPR